MSDILFNVNSEDLSGNIFDHLLGHYQWYRRWRKGLWRYSTFTNMWWKIVPLKAPKIPKVTEERYD